MNGSRFAAMLSATILFFFLKKRVFVFKFSPQEEHNET